MKRVMSVQNLKKTKHSLGGIRCRYLGDFWLLRRGYSVILKFSLLQSSPSALLPWFKRLLTFVTLSSEDIPSAPFFFRMTSVLELFVSSAFPPPSSVLLFFKVNFFKDWRRPDFEDPLMVFVLDF